MRRRSSSAPHATPSLAARRPRARFAAIVVAVAACALGGMLAPIAGAATVTGVARTAVDPGAPGKVPPTSFTSWQLRVEAGAGEANRIALAWTGAAYELRELGAGAPLIAGAGCAQVDLARVRCNPGGVFVTASAVALGDGEDELRADGSPLPAGMVVDAGGDADVVAIPASLAATLRGGAGDDRLTGSSSDDIVDGGPGADVLDGGAGNDTVTYEGRSEAVRVDLAAQGAGVRAGADGEGDRLAGFESVVGGAGADALRSSGARRGTVRGGPGDDRLDGTAADDTLEGDVGDDLLDGGAGSDRLDGEAGGDELRGGDGADRLTADDFGDSGEDVLDAGPGNDALAAGAGADVLRGGAGRDTLAHGLLQAPPSTATAAPSARQRAIAASAAARLHPPGPSGAVHPRSSAASVARQRWDGGPGDDRLFPGDLPHAERIEVRCGAGHDLVDGGRVPPSCERLLAGDGLVHPRVRLQPHAHRALLPVLAKPCSFLERARCAVRVEVRAADGRPVLARAHTTVTRRGPVRPIAIPVATRRALRALAQGTYVVRMAVVEPDGLGDVIRWRVLREPDPARRDRGLADAAQRP